MIADKDMKPEVQQLREEIQYEIDSVPKMASSTRSKLRRAYEALGECPRLSCGYALHQSRAEAGQQTQPHDRLPGKES